MNINKFGIECITFLFLLLAVQSLASSKKAITQYGNFCGTGQNDVPLYKSGKKKEPIDSLDKICQKHDQCYQARKEMSSPSGYTEEVREVACICQKKLAENLSSAKFESGKSEYNYRLCLAAAYLYLQTTRCYYKNKNEKKSICPPPVSASLGDEGYCYKKWAENQ